MSATRSHTDTRTDLNMKGKVSERLIRTLRSKLPDESTLEVRVIRIDGDEVEIEPCAVDESGETVLTWDSVVLREGDTIKFEGMTVPIQIVGG